MAVRRRPSVILPDCSNRLSRPDTGILRMTQITAKYFQYTLLNVKTQTVNSVIRFYTV